MCARGGAAGPFTGMQCVIILNLRFTLYWTVASAARGPAAVHHCVELFLLIPKRILNTVLYNPDRMQPGYRCFLVPEST